MFTIRTSIPKAGNKCYITTSAGGWSICIIGKPTNKNCNVLANCVGYACGRFNEIFNELTGYNGMKYKELNCNAEDFITRGKQLGLKVSNYPTIGGIMVWKCGNTGNTNDGAGHVAVVERINMVDENNYPISIFLSESGYNSAYFWNSTRDNTNGRWGEGSKYEFLGCLINPAFNKQNTITPNVPRNKFNNQIEVKISNLRVRTKPGLKEEILGYANKGYYYYFDSKKVDNYTWYKIDDNNWIASNPDWTTIYPKEALKYKIGDKVILNGYLYRDAKGNGKGQKRTNYQCTITKIYDGIGNIRPYNVNNGLGWVAQEDLKLINDKLQVGDYVKIIKTGNGSADGTSNTAYGIGLKRKILKIYLGYKYPYQVGNSNSTIGFYQANALEKIL